MREEAMKDFDTQSGKTGAWNAYDVWKTTIREPRNERAVFVGRAYGDLLDEQEDRLRLRLRKLRRALTILLLVVAGGVGLLADHYFTVTHEQQHDRLASIAQDAE